jgi:uncharacterized protein YciI
MDVGADPAAGLLGRDYWLIVSRPTQGTSREDIGAVVPAHLRWLLALEAEGRVLLSGPLLDGPGVGPGSGVTVLRARDADEASRIAARDPFVVAGLRAFDVFQWRLNEGSISVTISLGTGRYAWD